MALKTGSGGPSPDIPSHVPGIKSGNSKGNYDKQPGHKPDGTSAAARSTGVAPPDHEPIDPSMPNLSPA